MSISNFKLYQIGNDYERAIDALLMNEEKDESKIEEIKDNFSAKCIAVAKYIKSLEAEQEAIESAGKAMLERAKKVNAHKDSLTNYLQYNIEKTGLIDSIKCAEFEIKLRKNPPSLIIEDESLIPDLYIKVKEVKTFDKNSIKKDILDGFEVEGAKVVSNKTLVIK